jgi:magnesium transporter
MRMERAQRWFSVIWVSTGFQIGLSPLSPGFTIVPLDRRRRTSGTGRPSLADVTNDIIIGLREAERWRAASEGELTRTSLNEVQDVSRDDGDPNKVSV